MKFDPEVNPILDFIKSKTDSTETREYAFKHAVDFYNRKKYFEAHEVFEFQWKKETGNRKLLIHSLIQISVAMNKLYVNINLKGAFSQATLALEKLLVLVSNQCFTREGILYCSYLIENLKSLLGLFEKNPVDYSNYSPPKLLVDSDSLFL